MTKPQTVQRDNPSAFYRGEYSGKSSIGGVDGIYLAGDRMKGVLPMLVNTTEDLAYLVKVIEHFKQNLEDSPHHSRLTVRAVVAKDLLVNDSEPLQVIRPYIEVLMPVCRLDGENREHYIVYLGFNKEHRRLKLGQHEMYLGNIQRARVSADAKTGLTERTIHNMAQIIKSGSRECQFQSKDERDVFYVRLVDDVSKLEKSHMDDINRLMYKFDYNAEDVRRLIENPANRLTLTFLGDRVVGVAVVEKATIDFGGRCKLRIVELTDAVVDEKYQGNNIYYYASLFTFLSLLHNDKVDVIYGESNLKMPGVLAAAHLQWRDFTSDIAAQFNGTLGRGFLENHAVIGGEYSSLVVTFFRSETLQRIRTHLRN